MLENENILKLIFDSITLRNLKHMLVTIESKAITRIITRILNYKNIFKTIGKTKTCLYPNHYCRRAMSIAILPDNKVRTLYILGINNTYYMGY
jgi:hypothetical protein